MFLKPGPACQHRSPRSDVEAAAVRAATPGCCQQTTCCSAYRTLRRWRDNCGFNPPANLAYCGRAFRSNRCAARLQRKNVVANSGYPSSALKWAPAAAKACRMQTRSVDVVLFVLQFDTHISSRTSQVRFRRSWFMPAPTSVWKQTSFCLNGAYAHTDTHTRARAHTHTHQSSVARICAQSVDEHSTKVHGNRTPQIRLLPRHICEEKKRKAKTRHGRRGSGHWMQAAL